MAAAVAAGVAATTATSGQPSQTAAPLFRFGVISDVQHADIPDGTSYHGVPRFYRNSLTALHRAMEQGWAAERVLFGLHCGDIIDGFCPKVPAVCCHCH